MLTATRHEVDPRAMLSLPRLARKKAALAASYLMRVIQRSTGNQFVATCFIDDEHNPPVPRSTYIRRETDNATGEPVVQYRLDTGHGWVFIENGDWILTSGNMRLRATADDLLTCFKPVPDPPPLLPLEVSAGSLRGN